MIWREKRLLLIVLGLLLAANTVFFFTYRVQYQTRLDELDERAAEAEAQLNQARTARIRSERQLASYKKIETDVQQVYVNHWSTQAERLTPMISEVQRLAKASSLMPRAYSFDKGEGESASARAGSPGGARRESAVGANEVGIGFTVEGTYEQARRLINLLELSRQFVIVDRISLSSREGQKLTLNLHVKTLFRDPAFVPRTNKRL
jgi:hypothetical protein